MLQKSKKKRQVKVLDKKEPARKLAQSKIDAFDLIFERQMDEPYRSQYRKQRKSEKL